MKSTHNYIILLLAILASCQTDKADNFQLFNVLEGKQTNILFNNQITEHDTLNPANYYYIYNGAGVAVADIDNDGLEDLFFAGNMVSNGLYLNKGNLKFEDISEKAGVTADRWCTGVTAVDINTDGFMDFYVCVADRNYTEKGRNLLFINNGNNTFTEKAEAYGLDDPDYSTHAAFLDYDLDGDLDMYLLTGGVKQVSQNIIRPTKMNGEGISTDKLFRNNGDNTFSDVSAEAGVTIEGYGLGVAIVDINKDGYPDIYAANDFIYNDLLYVNNGDGTFSNQLNEYMRQTPHNGMGIDAADYNNDGFVDLMTVDMLPEDNKRQKSMVIGMNYDKFQAKLRMGYHPQFVRNTLQLNNGDGSFSEVGRLAEIYKTDWSWSALFVDVDNDGLKDLLISNGYARDITDLDYIVYGLEDQLGDFGTNASREKLHYNLVKELPGIHVSNYFYKNEGDLSFSDQSKEWGIHRPSYSNGCAYADLDNDGDVDIVMNNINESAFVYENRSELLDVAEQNNYIRIKLEGSKLNPQGLGAKVKVNSGSLSQYHENYLARGYKSTMENVIHVGLGKETQVDKIEVIWQEGKISVLENLKANQELAIKYSEADGYQIKPLKQNQNTLFTEVDSTDSGINFQHIENAFVDFKNHPLLQHMYSRSGPGISIGDIDGNGLEDFYVGAAFGAQGMFFMQSADGKFNPKPLESSEKYEDMGSLLFDADNDGDLDLYVVSGGCSKPMNDEDYQDRLYINDGKGNYQQSDAALPKLVSSGSCVVATDFDKDNDLDLFVGARIIPNRFPKAGESFLLRNDGGKFEKIQVPELEKLGLVTSAVWSDFDNDGWTDLIVTGDWMPVTFFKNQEGELVNVSNESGIASEKGFWNSLVGGDFDNDGDIDYIAGNLGLNSQLKATEDQPVSIFAKDFDDNGSFDPIMTYFNQGENYPLHTRDMLIRQVQRYRGKYLKYSDFADAKGEDLLSAKDLEGAIKLKATYLKSSFVENLGGGKFKLKPLPNIAQISPAHGLVTGDFNGDQNLDVLMVGNLRSTELVSGYYDASIGNCLLGDGKGNFENLSALESGLNINGDAKGIAKINGKEGSYYLVPQNSGALKTVKLNASHSQVISAQPMDAYAEIYLGGNIQKVEFQYGSGYLSQSSRSLVVPKGAEKVLVYNFKGESREISLTDNVSMVP